MRSSTSSVLKWPDRASVERALRLWVADQAKKRPELLKLGFFGSYARNEWGPGSDLDLVAIVTGDGRTGTRPSDRSWDLETLPVPTEILVYTARQWKDLLASNSRLSRTLREEAVWVFDR